MSRGARYEKLKHIGGHTMTEKQYEAMIRWMNTHVVLGKTLELEKYPVLEYLTPWMDGRESEE